MKFEYASPFPALTKQKNNNKLKTRSRQWVVHKGVRDIKACGGGVNFRVCASLKGASIHRRAYNVRPKRHGRWAKPVGKIIVLS